jgi:hypothetical protein
MIAAGFELAEVSTLPKSVLSSAKELATKLREQSAVRIDSLVDDWRTNLFTDSPTERRGAATAASHIPARATTAAYCQVLEERR